MQKQVWILILVVLCGAAAWYFSRSKSGVSVSEIKNGPSTTDAGPSSSVAGGLNPSKSDPNKLAPSNIETTNAQKSPTKAITADPFDYGKTPPVKGDANAQVKSVVEAVKSGQHPEQLSVMISPKPFDVNTYRADKAKYINTVEPGRVFIPAQPGPNVQRIKPISPEFVKIPQDGSTVLRVQVLPNMPCTFTSFDNGKFSNELTSITVEANEKGIAETKFLGAPGTIEDVHILCASPLTSGQVRFTVNISKPITTQVNLK